MIAFRRRRWSVEARLRAARPEPRDEFVAGLTAHVSDAKRPARQTAAPRLGLALVATLAMLSAFGAVGGVGYAASAAKTVAQAANPVAIVKAVVVAAKPAPAPAPVVAAKPAPAPVVLSSSKGGQDDKGDKNKNKDEDKNKGKDKDDSPSKDQYKPGKGCGDPNHVHAKENECKKLK